MPISNKQLHELLVAAPTTGSTSASIKKIFLQNHLPSINNFNPSLRHIIIEILTADPQPLTAAVFHSIEQQHHALFQEAKQVMLSTRNILPRHTKVESLWWNEYLKDDETRADLYRKDNNRKSNDFCRLFRVPFEMFEQLVLMTITKKWYDPTRVDVTGRPCSDLELLILGALHLLGKNADNHQISMLTNISEDIHRTFFHKWCGWMMSIMNEYIYMPVDEEEAEYVEEGYARYGLVGCVGSIDCVHIGWNSCRAADRNSYSGKELYPSIVYEVICSNDRKILSVTKGFPGTRSDKTIVKTDATVRSLRTFELGLDPQHDGTSWLSQSAWTVRTLTGTTKTFKGKYLICDGGFLHWPCLVCGVPDASNPGLVELCKTIAAVRKDIECVFGILKKRFHSLKEWSSFRKQASIDNAFITCCILHNMLLAYDGYLEADKNIVPGGAAMAAVANKNTKCRTDAMWVRPKPIINAEDGSTVTDEVTPEENANWRLRLEAIGNHMLATKALVKEQRTRP